jgi:membrane dipeptidase
MDNDVLDRARDLNASTPVVEAHRDCYEQIHWLNMGEANPVRDRLLPRLEAGGVDLVIYAIGGDTLAHSNGRDKRLLATVENIMELKRLCDEDPARLMVARNKADLTSLPDGTTKFLLHLEGASPLEGNMSALESLYDLGVRSMQPTWNVRNELGDGVHERDTGGGLTRFGVSVVKRMEQLGMQIDLSHISETGFWHVLKVTEGPVVVTHANSSSLYEHPRNLTDEQAKAIGHRGGVIGIHTLPTFVGADSPTINDLVDHVSRLIDVVGIDHVGFGGDFVKEDGPRPGKEALFHDPRKAPPVLPGLGEVHELSNLTAALLTRGFSTDEIAAVLGGNFLRVLGETLHD